MNDRLVRKAARAILSTVAEMKVTPQTDTKRFEHLHRRLERQAKTYKLLTGSDDMETLIAYGRE